MRENEYQQVLDRIVQFRKQMGKTQVDCESKTSHEEINTDPQ